MTERQWELYRLSVVEEWQESPHKAAVIGAIKYKLMILALQEKRNSFLFVGNQLSLDFLNIRPKGPVESRLLQMAHPAQRSR